MIMGDVETVVVHLEVERLTGFSHILKTTYLQQACSFNLMCSPVTLLTNLSVVMGQVLHLLALQ